MTLLLPLSSSSPSRCLCCRRRRAATQHYSSARSQTLEPLRRFSPLRQFSLDVDAVEPCPSKRVKEGTGTVLKGSGRKRRRLERATERTKGRNKRETGEQLPGDAPAAPATDREIRGSAGDLAKALPESRVSRNEEKKTMSKKK